MRLALQTVICCCVFTTVLPLVRDATGELNSSLKKRFRVWLQSRLKRDLDSSLATANEECFDFHVGPEQDKDEGTVSPSLSSESNSRPRRSPSSNPSGCALVTCIYQELLHRLHQMSIIREATSPPGKTGMHGYGRRRRRSLLDLLQTEAQTEAASKECLAAEIEDNS